MPEEEVYLLLYSFAKNKLIYISLKVKYRYLRKQVSSFFRSEKGKKTGIWTRRMINTGVVLWLVYELSLVGWFNVWQSLPTQPLFYLIFFFLYFQLPFFEILIYRINWSFDSVRSIPVFLMKNIYNKDVLGYSGEVYFYLWAQKTLQYKKLDVFKIIKDNNIISSISSTLVAFSLLSIFFFTDQIKILDWVMQDSGNYIWGGTALLFVVVIVVIKFRRFVISMPLKNAYKIFGIHAARLTLNLFLVVLMYDIVIPDTPMYIWFTLLSVEIILSRIPFLPNRDLIFTGMGIGLAEGLQISTSAIAAILLTRTVLGKVMNLSFFAFSSIIKDKSAITDQNGKENDQIKYQNSSSK